MDRIEPVEPMDKMDPDEPMDRSEPPPLAAWPGFFAMRALCPVSWPVGMSAAAGKKGS
jgi:hypothetical protein